MKLLKAIFLISALNSGSAQAFLSVKDISRGYCAVTHPAEMINPIRHDNTCEEQHIVQQQVFEQKGDYSKLGPERIRSGYTDSDCKAKSLAPKNCANVSIIPVSSHITTDSWGARDTWGQKKVWEKAPEDDGWISGGKLDPWGLSLDSEIALEQAYKLGRWQIEYVFLLHNYNNDDWSTTLAKWDGVSHAVYMVSWWANLPAKYLRKTAYIIDKQPLYLLIDHALQIPILLIEGGVGTLYSVIGIVVGTIINPVDTLSSFAGGVYLGFKSLAMALVDLALSIWLLITVFI